MPRRSAQALASLVVEERRHSGRSGRIANAIFDATGARLFQMPMTLERIKKTITG